MEDREVKFNYKTFQPGELSANDQQLIQSAIDACQYAYAPYSNFKVGAAVRTDDQHIVIGSNQENSAFPIGQCAERVALYNLAHQLGRKIIDTI